MKEGSVLANKLKSKFNALLEPVKAHWNEPAKGNYLPYKEIIDIGLAGFGVHWTSTLAATIGLNAANFLVGASIGLRPLHLSIMLIIANIVGIPGGIFRGWFYDNHKMKGGKFLPLLRATPIPIVLISALFVWLPYEHWSYTVKAVVVWFMYMILQFVLAMYNDSWGFFQQVITPNAQERANSMSIFQIIYSLAPTITNLVVPTIAGLTFGMNNIWTYRIIYPGFTVVGLIVLLFFLPKLKERIVMPKQRIEYISIVDSLREVAKNKYFWIINVASWIGFLEGAYMVVLQWSFVYGNNGEQQALLGLVNTIIGNAALWSMMLTPFLIRRFGKRNLLILHNSVNVLLMAILLFTYHNLVMVCVVFYLNAFINTFANIYMPNINADIRDYHQWKTGVRLDGLFGTLSIIGTVIGFFTGMVVPAIYEHMGLYDDYNVLYDTVLRNNLFNVLIICSIIGAILNLIPFLFYDLTEAKHRGYVNVLKIRAMFEDYGNNDLDDEELLDAMKIIESARELQGHENLPYDKSDLKAAKKMPKKTPAQKAARKAAIREARAKLRDIRLENEFIESLPIVLDELQKFDTERYKRQLSAAKQTVSYGSIYAYDNWASELQAAKAMPKATKEEREIRADAIQLARAKGKSAKLLKKHEKDYIVPDAHTKEALESREVHSLKENIEARRDLKKYTKAVSLYRRISMPYTTASTLVIQAENYTHLAEIEALYQQALQRAKDNEAVKSAAPTV